MKGCCTDATIDEALECQRTLRKLLDEKVFKIIARWIKKCKEDGKMTTACMLHAHLAYLFRNVQILTPNVVFAVLASQVFLFNNYKYDLDLEPLKNEKRTRKDTNESYKDDLGIPQVELFDMFQKNRVRIMKWLMDDVDNRNAVMDAVVQLVEEGTNKHQVGKNNTREKVNHNMTANALVTRVLVRAADTLATKVLGECQA